MARFHTSLNTPRTFLGGDREAMMGVMGMSIAVPLVYQNFPSFIAGAGVWALGAYILRLAAKNDPQMRHVYRRSLKYKGYLPAQAHYDAPYPKSK